MFTLILVFLARWLVYLILITVIIIGLNKWGPKTTIKVTIIALTSWLLSEILKYVFNTSRPFMALGVTTP